MSHTNKLPIALVVQNFHVQGVPHDWSIHVYYRKNASRRNLINRTISLMSISFLY